MIKFKKITSFLLAALMVTSLTACNKSDKKSATPTDADESVDPATLINQTADEDVPELEGYTLLWHDEFNGTKLDDSIWSYDPHEPGWTNNELQEYTTSTDNVFVKDGALHLKAIKTTYDNGNEYYTSGKVKTQNKKDFMYGRVEVRAKVPKGQGLWPAAWMMPTDESYYGQWPKCGEIDIMEVLGSQTYISYSTIHYGEPHAEQQGIYEPFGQDFAKDYHTYVVEWEPGEMRFYTDDYPVLKVNDWFTAVTGEDEKPYPAPFNQTFFVQLNLAVGGTWPGNPDETTNFDNAEFLIDYVRVYQKPEYDTNVKKPEVNFREVTEDGNLIYNGDFADAENLDDKENWFFLLFEGGVGAAGIADNTITITSEKPGTVDYGVQLVQPSLPMRKGHKYRLTFDARADEPRTMITCVSAPTAGWIRYLQDTKLDLTTEFTTYTYEFEMNEKDDNNGRLEFNMGNQDSTATIQIKNVRIEDITE